MTNHLRYTSSRFLGVLAVLLVVVVVREASGLLETNVDTRMPLLRMSPGGNDAGDLFGFSFTFHDLSVIDSGDNAADAAEKTRLVIGAPRGTYPGGLDLPDPGKPAESNTGLVFGCSLLPGSDAEEELCYGVTGDNVTGDVINTLELTIDNDFLSGGNRLFDHRPNGMTLNTFFVPVQAEIKEKQFLGASVVSREGILIVCAPLWISTGTYNSSIGQTGNCPSEDETAIPTGRCYFMDRPLRRTDFLDPCNLDTDLDVSVDMGYCSTGTGVDVIQSDRYVIGSTGYQYGAGVMFYGNTQADMLVRDNTLVGRGNFKHPIADGTQQLVRELSQAFQVATGYITIPKTSPTQPPPNSLASVPRFDSSVYIGKIDIYDARATDGDISNLLPVTAQGTQMGEFFGYGFDTVDINGDGWDDVVVGAPMYSDITDSGVAIEVGRVYVFINNQDGSLSDDPIVFEGKVERGRLGMSVQDLGDIDNDGYEDFAAGAPYEQDGVSTGAVYLFHGNSNITVFRSQEPFKISSQETADSLSDATYLQLFGFDLASFDFDNNNYSDLAVSAPNSSSVVAFRTRPVARVSVDNVSSIVATVIRSSTMCEVGGNMFSCFLLDIRVSFTGLGLPEMIEVIVEISEVLPQVGDRSRVYFNQDVNQTASNVTIMVTEADGGQTSVPVYLQTEVDDFDAPLQLSVNVQPNSISQPTTPSNGRPAIDDISGDFLIPLPVTGSFQVPIRDCQVDVCETDYSLTSNNVTYPLNSGGETDAIVIDGVSRARVMLTISNLGEEIARDLRLSLSHTTMGVFSDDYTILISSQDAIECDISIPCPVPDVFRGKSLDIEVVLNVVDTPTNGTLDTTFTVSSLDTTNDPIPSNNTVVISHSVERRFDLKVTAIFPSDEVMYDNIVPEEPKQRMDVGESLTLELRVTNVLPTDVDSVSLDVFFPARATETGEYFYLLPECGFTSSTTEGEINCVPENLDSVSNIACSAEERRKRHAISPTVKQRWRRAAAASGGGGRAGRKLSHHLFRRQTTNSPLNCAVSPEQCLKISCAITQLRGSSASEAKISITGYVDERFFAANYAADQKYQLGAMASVSINGTQRYTSEAGPEPNSATAILTVSPQQISDSGRRESDLTIVFVILAVIIGPIIIIAIITVILWRCGFFKRKRREGEEEEDEEVPTGPPADDKATAPAEPEATTL